MTVEAEIAELMALTEEEVWATLGVEIALAQPELGISPTDTQSLVEQARSWFSTRKDGLQHAVCGSDVVRASAAANAGPARTLAVVSAIMDALPLEELGVPPLAVAVLIYRQSLQHFCRAFW